jgi:hypothetical protein
MGVGRAQNLRVQDIAYFVIRVEIEVAGEAGGAGHLVERI